MSVFLSIRRYSRINIAKYVNDGLDSSIQTMDNVMAILQEVEQQERKPKQPWASQFLIALKTQDADFLNRYTQKFGEQIFNYRALYEINSRPYLVSNPWLLDGFERNIQVVLNRFSARALSPPSNSFFRRYPEISLDSRLTYAQTVARYFVLNPQHCKHRLSIDLHHMAKEIITYDKNKALKGAYLKPKDHQVRGDPLVIRTRLPQDFRNSLAFMVKDEEVIKSLLDDKTMFVMPTMTLDEMEGQLAFEITCKQILFKIQERKEEEEDSQMTESVKEPPKSSFFLEDNKQYWEQKYVQQHDFFTGNTAKRSAMQFNFASVVKVDRAAYPDLKPPHVIPNAEVLADYSNLNDQLLLSKFLENKECLRSIKIAVCYKSGLMWRLINNPNKPIYQLALASSDYLEALVNDNQDEGIKDLMVSTFDRFFARFYAAHSLQAEAWLVSLVDALGRFPLIVNDELEQEAIQEFKTRIDEGKLMQGKGKTGGVLHDFKRDYRMNIR